MRPVTKPWFDEQAGDGDEIDGNGRLGTPRIESVILAIYGRF